MMTELTHVTIEKILNGVRVKEEAEELLAAIVEIEKSIYVSDHAVFEQALKKYIPGSIYRLLRSDAQASLSDEHDRGSVQEFLAELKGALERLIPLKIDLAFDPNEELIEKLNEWVRTKLGSHIIIDFGTDRALRGGMRIIFKGRYREFTFNQNIEQALEAEKKLLFPRGT